MITVLTGENSYEIAQTLRRLRASFKGEPELIDGLDLTKQQLPDLFMGGTLFASERLIVINDLSGNKSLWNELEVWCERVPDDTHLVLIEPKPDKRTKTFKWLQKNANLQTHVQPKEPALVHWVVAASRERGIEISQEVARCLTMHSTHDQWQLSKELDKLKLSQKPISIDLINEIVPQSSEARAFDVLDAAFAGKSSVLDEQMDSMKLYEEPYRFFGLLANQVVILAAASQAGGVSSQQFASDIGAHPFVAGKMQSLARSLGDERVKSIVSHVARLDRDLKTMSADPWLLIEATLRTLK